MTQGRRRQGRKASRPCTYELGYVRQDLYACRKCTREANGVLSGFCRGCRETCHASHPDEVFELYTKRSFRCDCGNKRAKNVCSLFPNKDDFNMENQHSYSHNFVGNYCRCDSEYDYRLAMAQCAMCEDWFHEKCYTLDALGRKRTSPYDMEYELTCKDCVKTLPVLAEYYELLSVWKKKVYVRKPKGERCVRPNNVSVVTKAGSVDYMWRPGFRSYLCRCKDCMELYRSSKVLYIVDRNDFVSPASEDEESEGYVEQEDHDDDDDEEIIAVEEVSESESSAPKAFDEGERIPRRPRQLNKPAPPQKPIQEPKKPRQGNEALGVHEIMNIRRRITDFLREAIQTNGGNLNRASLLSYMSELKAELLSEAAERI
ncbi:E3 ubiquitin-protein ligase UBR7 [Gracilaria domingensis]|nr:E3 ubiquitin-protein ligase UBR7 [Gracilaria domingensis]